MGRAELNELSGRYSEVPDLIQATPPDGWRRQSKSNRQGSSGLVDAWPDGWSVKGDAAKGGTVFCGEPVDGNRDHLRITGWDALEPGEAANPGAYLSRQEEILHGQIRAFYETLLKFGVAEANRARSGRWAATPSASARWTSATGCRSCPCGWPGRARPRRGPTPGSSRGEIIEPLYPVTFEAFKDYVLGEVTLSTIDIDVVRLITAFGVTADEALEHVENKTERNECRGKLLRLGLLREEGLIDAET